MVNIRALDPSASPLDFYGAELRRLREAAGLNQKQLGELLYCTASLIGQIETASKVPTRPFSKQVDAALKTDGVMVRLLGLVLRSQLPSWFQPYAKMEAKATYISTYQTQVVYGLLQTPEYARAVLGAPSPKNLDELVEARMERQQILLRESPPLIWVVLDEAVLHRVIGSRETMRRQLDRLLSFDGQRAVQIQVLPFEAGQHPGLTGSFNLLRFEEDHDIVYTDDFYSGHMTANPEAVMEGWLRYSRLQAAALSVEDSAALISRVMEERYGDKP
ncbi:transcriptional regulator [Streptomyces sulfonofaciens]|uniref:Transcriptional regulator n=1 Tax=Streptomyces sulfonofaciens TaxID=68272 RepID=A0A919FS40_9ACTN|nr:helix-turn-helix transcriptional regulator [Streptomyces sulfonofaciens]GHH70699.1 transcriptional regulator [Streptomyces sulfonofaciens]